MFKPKPVVSLSICKCGFPILREGIPLGTVYLVDLDARGDGTLICGGCGASLPIMLVPVKAKGTSYGGMLPAGVFEVLN